MKNHQKSATKGDEIFSSKNIWGMAFFFIAHHTSTLMHVNSFVTGRISNSSLLKAGWKNGKNGSLLNAMQNPSYLVIWRKNFVIAAH